MFRSFKHKKRKVSNDTLYPTVCFLVIHLTNTQIYKYFTNKRLERFMFCFLFVLSHFCLFLNAFTEFEIWKTVDFLQNYSASFRILNFCNGSWRYIFCKIPNPLFETVYSPLSFCNGLFIKKQNKTKQNKKQTTNKRNERKTTTTTRYFKVLCLGVVTYSAKSIFCWCFRLFVYVIQDF